MSQVIIAGDTSGTITLQAPAVSGTTTLTLPATTATLATLTTPSFATTIGVGGATASGSGSGITFPATQSASSDANTLDDYEEGTWTPTTSTSGYTISSSNGTYTKIGRLVTLRFEVTFSAINGSSSSTMQLSSAPFTTPSSSGRATGIARDCTSTGTIYALFIDNSATSITMNSYSGVSSGSSRIFAISENYVGLITYFV